MTSIETLLETQAQAINYCHVMLTEEKDSNTLIHNHYVRYNDTYVREGGKWLIQRRIANFMISNSREMA